MLTRCFNANDHGYTAYGGRGITVCERWRVFENFLADMGERPEGTTIDRFPNRDGNYEPGNCRWATPREQARNRKSGYLTADLVNEIRGRREHGEPQISIARRMGIPLDNVGNVCRRATWKDIP